MDTQAIFKASHHHLGLVAWGNPGPHEWQICGSSDEFRTEAVAEAIGKHLPSETLFFAGQRKDCYEIPKSTAAEFVHRHLASGQVFLWDTSFQSVIEFNKIGVFRVGTRPA